jgi:hypothetical protein
MAATQARRGSPIAAKYYPLNQSPYDTTHLFATTTRSAAE